MSTYAGVNVSSNFKEKEPLLHELGIQPKKILRSVKPNTVDLESKRMKRKNPVS